MRLRTVHEVELQFQIDQLNHRIAELEYRLHNQTGAIELSGPVAPQEIALKSNIATLSIIASWQTHYDVGGWQVVGRTFYPKEREIMLTHWVSEPDLLTVEDSVYYLNEMHSRVMQEFAEFAVKARRE